MSVGLPTSRHYHQLLADDAGDPMLGACHGCQGPSSHSRYQTELHVFVGVVCDENVGPLYHSSIDMAHEVPVSIRSGTCRAKYGMQSPPAPPPPPPDPKTLAPPKLNRHPKPYKSKTAYLEVRRSLITIGL